MGVGGHPELMGAEGTGHRAPDITLPLHLIWTWATQKHTGMLVRLAKFSTPRLDYDPVNVSDE